MAALQAVLQLHPVKPTHADAMSRSIEACFNCVATCTACADACLSERDVEHLFACIRTNLDCAAVCTATGVLVARSKAGATRQILEGQLSVCIAVCRACANECQHHADVHDHCRVCAEACEACAEACSDMLGALRAVV